MFNLNPMCNSLFFFLFLFLTTSSFAQNTEAILPSSTYQVYELTPPKFTIVEERVAVNHPYTRLVFEPPKYKTIVEKVIISPASRKWVKSKHQRTNGCFFGPPESCIRWELAETPVYYSTITQMVLAIPAHVKRETVKTKVRPKVIVEKPAGLQKYILSKQ